MAGDQGSFVNSSVNAQFKVICSAVMEIPCIALKASAKSVTRVCTKAFRKLQSNRLCSSLEWPGAERKGGRDNRRRE